MSLALPWLRLQAEADTFPFASEESFGWGGVALARSPDYEPLDSLGPLADRFTGHVRPMAQGLSVEAIEGIRNLSWFDPDAPVQRLHHHLRRVAAKCLGWEGSFVAIHCPVGKVDLAERAHLWRCLTLRAPEDLFVAAVVAPKPGDPPSEGVRLLLPQLEHALDETDVAETHVHLGGAISSGVLWSALTATLHHDQTLQSNLALLGPAAAFPFGGPVAFEYALLSACVVRLVTAAWLDAHEPDRSRPVVFKSWLVSYADQVRRSAAVHEVPFDVADMLERTVYELCKGTLRTSPDDLDTVRKLYGAMLRTEVPDRDPNDPRIIEDPLTTRAGKRRAGIPVETWFATLSLRWLDAPPAPPPGPRSPDEPEPVEDIVSFERMFWQYQRVRGAFHRYLTQTPGTAGLDWFSLHYRRVMAFTRSIDRELPALALRHGAAGLKLGAFEARVAPPKLWADLKNLTRWFVDSACDLSRPRAPVDPSRPEALPPANAHSPEVGLILHLLRDRRLTPADTAHSSPERSGARYRSWYRDGAPRVEALRIFFEEYPEALVVLRGLDVANLELTAPTWAFAPLFRAARESSRVAAALLARRQPTWRVPPMRATAHAGEDFRRLSEGLRRVHELLRYGVLMRGDRIGHGLALGGDPDRWALGAPTTVQPCGERLDDLLWELDVLGKGLIPSDASRLETVRVEAKDLARTIYGRGRFAPDLDDLVALRDALHGDAGEAILAHGDLNRKPPLPMLDETMQELLLRHCTAPEVYHRAVVPIEVVTTPAEVAMLHAMQRYLWNLLGRLEITVETNPSSNMLIGDLVSLDEHPAFRLSPLAGRSERSRSPVLLSLNSDDPVTFATRLSDEYAHIYFALLRIGVAADEALAWVDRQRINGWRSRFTIPLSRDHDVMKAIRDRLR